MNILDKIVNDKKLEVYSKKKILPVSFLEKSPLFTRKTGSLSESLKRGSGVIAEFKRRSPSKNIINHSSSVVDVVTKYQEAGVSGISVLTDAKYFGGSLEDLILARNAVEIPILRKEFIIDVYQIFEAKAFGADTILLIAAILDRDQIKDFSKKAKELGMDVLLEIHNQEELLNSNLEFVDLVGINNRNLKTFEVSLETSINLSGLIPKDKVKISESGISSVEAIQMLKKYDFKGFLIGENFMKSKNPGLEAIRFLKKIRV